MDKIFHETEILKRNQTKILEIKHFTKYTMLSLNKGLMNIDEAEKECLSSNMYGEREGSSSMYGEREGTRSPIT